MVVMRMLRKYMVPSDEVMTRGVACRVGAGLDGAAQDRRAAVIGPHGVVQPEC